MFLNVTLCYASQLKKYSGGVRCYNMAPGTGKTEIVDQWFQRIGTLGINSNIPLQLYLCFFVFKKTRRNTLPAQTRPGQRSGI